MMQQYQRLRKSIPADTLLMFRLGDFYEMFFDDAKEASGLLNVALTKRNGVPMCGVPYHAAHGYVRRLIKAGRRVAICDQMSEPQRGRKIVDREVTQIISAGTVSELSWLDAKRANYLGAVYVDNGVFGFAYADLSTGEFRLTQAHDQESLLDQLARVSPAELLISSEQKADIGEIDHALEYDSYAFLPEQAIFTLCEHFKVKSLDGFGCAQMPAAVAAAGAIVGARKLRTWILQPLRDLAELQRRQQSIADLLQEPDLLASIRAELKSIRDIERAAGRLSQASGNARDLVALKSSLQQIPALKSELGKLIERIEFGRAGSPSSPDSVEAAVSAA
jgi:DNA mismatch repair protein MutS